MDKLFKPNFVKLLMAVMPLVFNYQSVGLVELELLALEVAKNAIFHIVSIPEATGYGQS